MARGRPVLDLSGRRYGTLRVLGPTPGREYKSVLWRCVCDCGSRTLVAGRSLNKHAFAACECALRFSIRGEVSSQYIAAELGLDVREVLALERSAMNKLRTAWLALEGP